MGGTLILFSLRARRPCCSPICSNRYVWLVLLRHGRLRADRLRRRLPQGAPAATRAGLPGAHEVRWRSSRSRLARRRRLCTWLGARFDATVTMPFFKNVRPDLGWFYVPFAALVIVGASNAVNLTDGLDGLAIGPVMIAARHLRASSPTSPATRSSPSTCRSPYVPGAGELAIFCGALVGAGLGFLWFNAYPAQMFMGDVGSLPLGAALGVLALITKQELVLRARRRRLRGRGAVGDRAGRLVQARAASASSGWRRSTITSSCWAGPSRRSSCASGSSRSSARCSRSVDAEAAMSDGRRHAARW